MDLEYFLNQTKEKDLREWKSKKELENFLSEALEKNRNFKVIGYITKKTLIKWKDEKYVNNRGLRPLDDKLYIVQKGYVYLYLIFNGKYNMFQYRCK